MAPISTQRTKLIPSDGENQGLTNFSSALIQRLHVALPDYRVGLAVTHFGHHRKEVWSLSFLVRTTENLIHHLIVKPIQHLLEKNIHTGIEGAL